LGFEDRDPIQQCRRKYVSKANQLHSYRLLPKYPGEESMEAIGFAGVPGQSLNIAKCDPTLRKSQRLLFA
jgi:hypothetical protein